MDAGRLDRRVAFYRRTVRAVPVAGNNRGPFEATPWLTVWANFRQTPGRELVSAGLAEDPIGGTLRIRDSRQARLVTAADRATLSGVSYAIASVGQPERSEGYIEMVLKRELAG